MKLLWLILVATAATGYVIYRSIMAAVDDVAVKKLIDRLKKDNTKAKDFADTLDIPYGRRENFSREDFDNLKSIVQAATTIHNYKILYQTDVDATRYLLIVEIQFSDFDITVTGKPDDVERKAYHFFVLRFEPDTNTLSIWSDLYTDSTMKFQKEAFSNGLVAHNHA